MGQFAKYAAAGGVGTVAQYVILYVSVSSGRSGPVVASAIGAVVGALVNYVLNYYLTFTRQGTHARSAPRFFCVAGLGLATNVAVMSALTHSFPHLFMVAQVLATATTLCMTFLVNSIWTFKTHDD